MEPLNVYRAETRYGKEDQGWIAEYRHTDGHLIIAEGRTKQEARCACWSAITQYKNRKASQIYDESRIAMSPASGGHGAALCSQQAQRVNWH